MTLQQAKDGVALSTFLMRLILLCMLPLVLLASWLAYANVLSEQEERDRDAARLADNFTATIDQYLRARIRGLNMLAVSPLLNDKRRWPELYREAQGFQESFGSHVILADAEEPRQMLFNTRSPFGAKLPALPRSKGHAAAPSAVTTGNPAVSDIFWGPIAHEPLVAIAVPVKRSGRTAFVLLTTFETGKFAQQLDQATLPPGWSLSLLDSRGEVIARRAPPGFNVNDVDTTGRFVARSRDSFWSVAVEIPRKAYQTPVFIAASVLGAGLLGATLIGILGGMMAGRRLGRAVAGLAYPGTELPFAIAEIEAARMVLEQATEEVRESGERFRRLFNEAPTPLCFVDKHGVLRDRNRRFTQTFGYSDEELQTLADWRHHAFPDPVYRTQAIEAWSAAVMHAVATGDDIEPGEYRITCKDGSERTMLISGITIGEDFLATFFDLTERKQTELKLAAALKEQKQGRLSTLNQMEDAIAARRSAEKAWKELRQLNITLEQRVNERTVELLAANRELDAFAYAVSHDLRAPLRAMIGFSQALIDDYGQTLDDSARDYLDEIQLASRNMGRLIDGLLTLSRTTRGDIISEPFELGAIVRRIRNELERSEPDRRVEWQIAEEFPGCGDSRMLEVVMQNLLANAWKYTAKTPAPRISVYREERDGSCYICVADNGAGFDMRHTDRLFKPFQRLHRQDEFPGIGIGLATVQRIINRHGGSIEAEGKPGNGAVFRFTLGT